MAFYIILAVLTVAVAYFVNSGHRREIIGETNTRQQALNRVCLFVIWCILFAVSAFRIGIGNDYWTYRDGFLDIARGDTKVSYEYGFRALVLTVQYFCGLFNYRAVFGVVAALTCALSLKGIYDSADNFVYSFFLFMAGGLYFMSFTNIRYYLAIAIILCAMKPFFRQKYVQFVLLVILAALIHKTALLVIPAYLFAYFFKWSRKTFWIIPVLALALVVGKPIVRKVLFLVYPYYEGDALLDQARFSYVNILKCAAVLVLALIFYKKTVQGDKKAQTLFNLNLFALIGYTCGSYIPEISRVCYYLVISQVFLIPHVLIGIENKKLRRFFTIAVAVAYILYFIVFLIQGKNNDYVMILPYLSWLNY